MKELIKKAVFLIRDIVEVYTPVIAFLGLFGVFVLQVFCRYILRSPQSWATEVTATCFLWVILLGACYAQRKKSHVQFTLLYDLLPIKLRAASAFLGNLIMVVAFALSLKPTCNFVLFMDVQKTSILKISMSIIYAPYIVFIVFIAIYLLVEMYEDFMIFTGIGGEKYIRKMEEEGKSEAQKAIEDVMEGEDAG